MFPRAQRLARRRDIDRLIKTGRRASGPFLLLRFAPNQQETSRLTVVVGATVSKKAVVRNRIKRRLREILKSHLATAGGGFDIMLSVKPAALKVERPELVKEVGYLLHRANILKNNKKT